MLDKNEEKQLIVLHTIGSHYRYDYRYPKEFQQFKLENQQQLSR